MRALIVYESMFGNTHAIAEAIAQGLTRAGEVDARVVAAAAADHDALRAADLVVAGGPTHVHGMARPASRHSAAQMASKAGAGLVLEPGAEGLGLREWLRDLPHVPRLGAAFDTRATGPTIFTGRASRVIARRLRDRGLVLVTRPESFVVDGHNHLRAGELDRAIGWGERLAFAVRSRTPVLA
jgi:hypothetical protein